MSEGFNSYRDIFGDIETNLQLKILPKLKMNMRSASANIANLMDILVRKSFLKEDLYRYDDKIINKFELPEPKVLDEQKKPEEIFLRLKALTGALNYLADAMPNSLDDMIDEYLENCLKAIEYFAFHNLASSNNPNSRVMKEITDKIQGSTDEVFKRIMSDNMKLLIDSFHLIKNTVEEIYKILKALYKSQIRFEVMPDVPGNQFTHDLFKSDQQKYLDNFNLYMNTNCSVIGFKQKWIAEAISDYYTVDEVEALSKIRKDFIGEKDAKTEEKKTLSPHEKLIVLIFDLAGSKKILQDIYYDLDYNIKLTRSGELTFMQKLVKTLRTVFNIEDDNDFFHIEYVNPTTKRVQKDTIKIDDFILSIRKKIQTFDEILKPNSDANYKIKNGTNESLLKFLDTTYFGIVLLKERIISINTEIRSESASAIKRKLKDLTGNAQALDQLLNKIGIQRRKFVMDQEQFNGGKK